MKYIAVALTMGVAFLWSVSPARADEASKSAKAEQLLRLTLSDQTMRQLLDQIKALQAAQMKGQEMPAELRAKASEMEERISTLVTDHFRKAEPALAQIYADTYTEEEIDGILAFYESPAGKALLGKTPDVMKRSTPVMIQIMNDLQPEMNKILAEMKEWAESSLPADSP